MIINAAVSAFGEWVMQRGFKRFGRWIATRVLPFHRWLRKRALERYHDSLDDMMINDRNWWSFHKKISELLDDSNVESVLALCGKKQCELVDRRIYYKLFYDWSKRRASDVRVSRIFVQKDEHGFDTTTLKDIADHRSHPRVFALEVTHDKLGGLQSRTRKLRAQLEKGFGLVAFCYKGGERVVVTHEGSKQTPFAVLKDEHNCREVLDLYWYLCLLGDESNKTRTALVQSKVKKLCIGY